MSRRTLGKSTPTSYPADLQHAMRRFLPPTSLPLLNDDGRIRWVPRMLVIAAILMAWSPALHLVDRFAEAYDAVVAMFPGRRRPGRTHEGFAAALSRQSQTLLESLCQHWRVAVRQTAGAYWEVGGWLLFGVDGSKFDCPRTAANEAAFGTSGKNNSGPQLLVTCLFHIGTGLLWDFCGDGLKGSSERGQLGRMQPTLPAHAMLLADAGFTGYDLLKSLLDGGRHFVIRVGSNVRLLKKLGYRVREHGQVVYLWPEQKQGRTGRHGRRLPRDLSKVSVPLVLRLITLVDERGRKMALLTDVLDRRKLSDASAARMYALRWGVEVAWRGLKQTLGRSRLHSASPAHVRTELDWAMAGFWMLGLLAVSRLIETGQDPRQASVAAALRAVREAMRPGGKRRRSLAGLLSEALKDDYVRRGSKKARHYPHKRRQKPPGMPRARNATDAEVRLAKRVRQREADKPLAA
jgi:hypothetical protein